MYMGNNGAPQHEASTQKNLTTTSTQGDTTKIHMWTNVQTTGQALSA